MVNSAGAARVAGNQVYGWDTGIRTDGTEKTVQKNLVTHNVVGISASSGLADIVANVFSANYNAGLGLFVQGNVLGNAFVGNSDGILITSGVFAGTIEKNNFAGNFGCGIRFFGGAGSSLTIPDNYWGAETGPGPDPADQACSGGTITATPFAAAPFKVKARVKP